MSYKAEDVGNYILVYCKEKNYEIPHPKLQKILYFIQAYFVTKKNDVCFEEEIEVSKSGPVITEVSHLYNRYGGYDLLIFDNNINLIPLEDSTISDEDGKIIQKIVDWLSNYSSGELFQFIKSQEIWNEATENTSKVIVPTKMKVFYGKP